jgi:hypothetical protein
MLMGSITRAFNDCVILPKVCLCWIDAHAQQPERAGFSVSSWLTMIMAAHVFRVEVSLAAGSTNASCPRITAVSAALIVLS